MSTLGKIFAQANDVLEHKAFHLIWIVKTARLLLELEKGSVSKVSMQQIAGEPITPL